MKKTILTSALLATLAGSVSAALTIEISGTSGSSTVIYTASGSITITEAVAVNSTSTGAAPVFDEWATTFDNNLGDMFQTDVSTDNNRTLSSAISYQLNTVEFAQIEAFDLTATNTVGGDDFQIDMDGTVSYPVLTIGDVISWSGSGTFTLSAETYDTFFESGTYTAPLNGGDYVINIAPVPEPSSTALLGLGGLALFLRRRK